MKLLLPALNRGPKSYLALLLCALLLASIAGLYLQPDFVIMMANQIWMCF